MTPDRKYKVGDCQPISIGETARTSVTRKPPLPDTELEKYLEIIRKESNIKEIQVDPNDPTRPVDIFTSDGEKTQKTIATMWNEAMTAIGDEKAKVERSEDAPRWYYTSDKLPDVTIAVEAIQRRRVIRRSSDVRDEAEDKLSKRILLDLLNEMSMKAVGHDRVRRKRLAGR